MVEREDARGGRRAPGTIAALRVHTARVPLARPFTTAVRTATEIDVVLVEALGADGASGWGEAACSRRVTGESPQSVRAAVEGPLTDAVVGRGADDPRAVAAAVRDALAFNSAARSAVVCAVYDLAAQRAGLPLAAYLGAPVGRDAPMLRTDMTLSCAPTDELVRRAREHVAEGFGALKVKVGGGFDDRAALPAVRAAVGDAVVLRADANQGWDAPQAIEIIRGWEEAGARLELVEQPVRAGRLDELARVAASVDTPVLADEAVWDADDLRAVIRAGAAGLVNIKLAKCGGIAEALDMIALAREAGIGVLIGCMMESSVGIAAAAAVAATLPDAGERAQDLDAGAWQRDSSGGALRYRGDVLVAGPGPGLGIRPVLDARPAPGARPEPGTRPAPGPGPAPGARDAAGSATS